MDNYLNQVLSDRYEIQEIIGVGGMAVVYKAYDRVDDRTVAVKILKDEYLANEEFRRRFKNESKAIAVLSHPNIVKVYDVCFGEKLQYIVMEHVEGITLKEYIERQKVVEWKESLHFVVQILRALQHAHDKGIIHRDIKPQNILLLPNASIKVTDFGIARFNRGEIRSVAENGAIGSVHYVSPEQARGDFTDEKSDIYSVGVVLYEMLTGQLPFESETDESVAIMQVQKDAVKPSEINPSIPIGLEQITLRAMQKNPADRYQSAAEFLLDLDEFKRNPLIKFDYSYFIDKTPTKYIGSSAEALRAGTAQTADAAADENDDSDDDSGEESGPSRNLTIQVLIGIAVSLVLIIGIIMLAAFGDTIKASITGKPASTEEESEGFFEKLDIFGWFSKDKLVVPNFINMKYEDALKEYPDCVIENPPQYEYNSTYEDGHVCNQTPEAGEKVSKDTVIKLTVATSGEMVLVKDVTNQQLSEAEKLLKADGLNVVPVANVDSTKEEGQVISTLPSGNTYITRGGTVYVYYASASENSNSLRVPNVVGYELAAAKAKIIAAGLKIGAVTQGASAASLKDHVISQSPDGFEPTKAGVYVNLIVGTGVPSSNTAQFNITLPELPTGTTNTIKTYLNDSAYDSIAGVVLDGKSYGLSFTGTGAENSFKIYIDSVLIYTGNIDFTTSPPTFSNVHAYQFASKEPVPNVIGLTQAAAVEALENAGFSRVKIQTQADSEVPEGCVISQSPVYSTVTTYSTATRVTLVISTGSGGQSEEPQSSEQPSYIEPSDIPEATTASGTADEPDDADD